MVTCDKDNSVFVGDVLVGGDTILAVGKDASRLAAAGPIVRVVDAEGAAVIPGFVQAHVHLCQALFRGMADDRPLLEWLVARIWPSCAVLC